MYIRIFLNTPFSLSLIQSICKSLRLAYRAYFLPSLVSDRTRLARVVYDKNSFEDYQQQRVEWRSIHLRVVCNAASRQQWYNYKSVSGT